MKNHLLYFKNIENKIQKDGILESDVIEFYMHIFSFQEKYYNYYKENKIKNSTVISNGLPLIKYDSLLVDNDIKLKTNEALNEIKSIIEKYHIRMTLDTLINKIENDKNLINEYLTLLLQHDFTRLNDISIDLRIGFDEFLYILINSIKPLFIYLKDENKDKIDTSDWFSSSCPFCGYYPDMSKIVDSLEGKRFLHCALCENEWPYERLSCTVCGNKNAANLGYFVTENKSPYRIDYCDECKAYIKTIKLVKTEAPDKYNLHIENIITPYLDYLAIEKGYMKQ